MTALEKFQEINGLEKLQKHYYNADLRAVEDENYPDTMVLIIPKGYGCYEFPYTISFEYFEDIEELESPYITVLIGYNAGVYDTSVSLYIAEDLVDFIKEVNKVLGLENK